MARLACSSSRSVPRDRAGECALYRQSLHRIVLRSLWGTPRLDGPRLLRERMFAANMSSRRIDLGAELSFKGSFVERRGLWDDTRIAMARDMLAAIQRDGLEVVRFVFADQHGITRGKTINQGAVADAIVNGCTVVSTLILKDTSHRTIMPVWQAGAGMNSPRLTGAADLIMVADPATFRRLPWAPTNGWGALRSVLSGWGARGTVHTTIATQGSGSIARSRARIAERA